MGFAKFLLGLVLIFALRNDLAEGSASNWNYTNQELWSEVAAICISGQKQSPIDIKKADATNSAEPSIQFGNNATKLGPVKMNWNGHGFSISEGGINSLNLSSGGLDGFYQLAQFHFHWGIPKMQGSEHRVDGKQWPAELHLVHHKSKFGDLGEALASNETDALAVVGVLINTVETSSSVLFSRLETGLDSLNSDTTTVPVDLSDVSVMNLLPKDLLHFWRYKGSLTTPTCNEQVVWTVLEETIAVPKSLLTKMATIKDKIGHNITYNARDTLPIGMRKVYYNGSGSPLPVFPSLFAFAIFAFLSAN